MSNLQVPLSGCQIATPSSIQAGKAALPPLRRIILREMMPGGWSIEDDADLVPNRARVKDLAKGDDAAVRAVAQLLGVDLDRPKCGPRDVTGPDVAEPEPDHEQAGVGLVAWANFIPHGGGATLEGGTVIRRILPGPEGMTVYYDPPEPKRDFDAKALAEARGELAEARAIIAGLLGAFASENHGDRARLAAKAANFLAPV